MKLPEPFAERLKRPYAEITRSELRAAIKSAIETTDSSTLATMIQLSSLQYCMEKIRHKLLAIPNNVDLIARQSYTYDLPRRVVRCPLTHARDEINELDEPMRWLFITSFYRAYDKATAERTADYHPFVMKLKGD